MSQRLTTEMFNPSNILVGWMHRAGERMPLISSHAEIGRYSGSDRESRGRVFVWSIVVNFAATGICRGCRFYTGCARPVQDLLEFVNAVNRNHHWLPLAGRQCTQNATHPSCDVAKPPVSHLI